MNAVLPVPRPTPVTQPYWEHAARGQLAVQRCTACAAMFLYPRPSCPNCASQALEWVVTGGTGTLQSYVIVHRAEPAFADRVPYVVALVELTEGPRLLSNLVDVPADPDALPLDLPLVVRFQTRDGIAMPVFAPAPEIG